MPVYTQAMTTAPDTTAASLKRLELDTELLVRTFDSMAAMRGMYPTPAARAAGIPHSALSHARNGVNKPSLHMVIKMLVWINQDASVVDLAPYLRMKEEEK